MFNNKFKKIVLGASLISVLLINSTFVVAKASTVNIEGISIEQEYMNIQFDSSMEDSFIVSDETDDNFMKIFSTLFDEIQK